jgi:hypothetical protein
VEGVAFMSGILFALLFSWNLLAATPAGCEGKNYQDLRINAKASLDEREIL